MAEGATTAKPEALQPRAEAEALRWNADPRGPQREA